MTKVSGFEAVSAADGPIFYPMSVASRSLQGSVLAGDSTLTVVPGSLRINQGVPVGRFTIDPAQAENVVDADAALAAALSPGRSATQAPAATPPSRRSGPGSAPPAAGLRVPLWLWLVLGGLLLLPLAWWLRRRGYGA